MEILERYDSLTTLHTPNYGENDSLSFYPTRTILAKIKPEYSINQILFKTKTPYKNYSTDTNKRNFYIINLSTDSAIKYSSILYETGAFEYVEPDFMSTSFLFGYFDNTFFNYQWSILNPNVNINLLPAWNITTGSKDVKIAIIDNGIDNYHPDLEVNILDGVDVVADEEYPSFVINGQYESDYDFHGTCCAGIIGAANNEIGIIGVAQTSKILSIRASHTVTYYSKALPPDTGSHHSINYEIRTSTKWLGDAFLCAHSICDADVVSCSMGLMYKPSEYVDNSIYEISHQGRQGKGIVIAISAGNTYDLPSIPYRDTLNFLSKNPNVISVGSINPCGKRVTLGQSCENNSIYNSCYGDSLDVVAPGISIPTTMINETFHLNFSGTSSAAPHVAGQAALILSVNPCLTREEVKYIIESTCTKISSDEYIYTNNENHPNGTWNIEVGYGLINVNDALLLAEQMGNYAYRNDTIIQTNYVWDENVRIDKDLVIDTLSMLLITDTLYISPTARIIVRPGGKLVVDGGVLTSACDGEMWQGIFVEGDRTRPQTAANQGTVELKNGAVVENAICGISTRSPEDQWNTTGGIVYASDAIFRNNRKSVEFLSYEDILPSGAVRTNLSSFSNCTFTVDNNNHFDNMQTEFDTHVSLWDVNNVKFYGCTFLNTATGPSAGKHAVYAEDAGFSVLPSCDMPENTYYGCVCPESHATYCSFGGFAKAVSAATSGTSFHVSIDQARFADNAVAVEISGNNFVSVTRCDFDLQSAPGNSLSTVGLSLDNCTGYLVEENFFHRSSMPMFYTACGITIRNSGGDNNQLYRNSFSKLDFATRVSGSNFRLISGLACSCNTYENNRYDIYLDRESSMSPIQGGQSKGADNTFSFTGSSSLYNAGTQNIRYYHSHDRSMFPYAPSSSFTTYATAASNPCVSTLCNEGPQHPDYPRSPGGDFENLRARYDSIADAAEDMMLFTDNSSHSDLDRSSYAGGKPSASAMASDTAVSELFLMSQRAVRFFLNDSASDIPAVRNWLSRTPGTPSHYALAEAEFQLGADNTAVLSDIASGRFDSQADRDEYDNFVAFDILKRTLTDHRGQHGTTMASVNWPSATPGQIAELQRIAEARTGRSSVMAQGVLCFFFDLCSDDFLESEQTTDTRSAEAPSVQPSGDGLVVSPNPTEGVLRVEGDGDISSVELYDTFGRLLLTRQCDGPLCILDIAGLNDGAYLLKVRFANGTVNSCKVVKK